MRSRRLINSMKTLKLTAEQNTRQWIATCLYMFSGKLAIPLQGNVTNQRLWLYEVYLYLHALAAASFLGPFLVPSTNIYRTKVPHQYYVLHCTNIFLDPLMPIAGVWRKDNITTLFLNLPNTNASHGDLTTRCFYTINKFLQSNKKLFLHIHAPPRVLPGYFQFRFFICLSMLVYVTFQGHKKVKKNWQ